MILRYCSESQSAVSKYWVKTELLFI